jgi:hypothetical protein
VRPPLAEPMGHRHRRRLIVIDGPAAQTGALLPARRCRHTSADDKQVTKPHRQVETFLPTKSVGGRGQTAHMATYIVSYDLRAPGQDYAELIEFLKNQPNWWHHLGSTWVVVSDSSAVTLRDVMRVYLDPNDKVLVVESSGTAAWRGFDERGSAWLKTHL